MQINAKETINKAKMDSLFETLESNNKVMGSVTIVKGKDIIYQKSIGYADFLKKLKSNKETQYRIGSISKVFTAVMIFQLIEEEKLQLNTPLAKFFPQVQNSEAITIENLLHHRSGIKSITNEPDYLTWCVNPKSQTEILELISRDMPSFEPNEYAEYSNSNFILLGYIIEKVTKNNYSSELKNRIVDKIDLESTYFGSKINTIKNQASSYEFDGESWKLSQETDMSIPGGAGAIVSTTEDLTKFITNLFNNKLVNANSLDKMKEIQDGLGMGLIKYPFYEKYAYGHDGSIDDFSSHLSYFPKEGYAFAMTTNGLDYSQNDILVGVLSILFEKLFEKPYVLPTFVQIDFTQEELEKYCGTYSSVEIPLKMTITKTKKGLIAQATGQSEFKLESKSKETFQFPPAKIELIFDLTDKTSIKNFTLKQSGTSYKFTK